MHLKNVSSPDTGYSPDFVFPVPSRISGFYEGYGKRIADIVFVLLAAPVILPLIAVFAAVMAMDGAAPFYWQDRIGRGGKIFRLLKIRTMVPNADVILAEYLGANPEARREWDQTQKLKKDPRITSVGNLLRKCSMDELPQFWNVLRGEMSLVGPRPMMVDQACLYPGVAYYQLRPGISGPWQVAERNKTSFADRAKYDEDYHQTMSLSVDVKILVRTILVVLRGTGY